MSFLDLQQPKPPSVAYLTTGTLVIFLLAAWATSFNHTCKSDGCIGIVFPAGGAFIALLVQLFVLLPIFCFRRTRQKLPFGRLAAAWVSGSLTAFVVPLVFVKL